MFSISRDLFLCSVNKINEMKQKRSNRWWCWWWWRPSLAKTAWWEIAFETLAIWSPRFRNKIMQITRATFCWVPVAFPTAARERSMMCLIRWRMVRTRSISDNLILNSTTTSERWSFIFMIHSTGHVNLIAMPPMSLISDWNQSRLWYGFPVRLFKVTVTVYEL